MAIQTHSDFKRQLEEQLYFINKSIMDFEANEIEAKRVATNIRILLHDTRSSTSLLTHLNKKDIPFIETKGPKGGLFSFHSGPGLDLQFDGRTINNLIWPYAGLVAKELKNNNGEILLIPGGKWFAKNRFRACLGFWNCRNDKSVL